jgi:hypothetical protein
MHCFQSSGWGIGSLAPRVVLVAIRVAVAAKSAPDSLREAGSLCVATATARPGSQPCHLQRGGSRLYWAFETEGFVGWMDTRLVEGTSCPADSSEPGIVVLLVPGHVVRRSGPDTRKQILAVTGLRACRVAAAAAAAGRGSRCFLCCTLEQRAAVPQTEFLHPRM